MQIFWKKFFFLRKLCRTTALKLIWKTERVQRMKKPYKITKLRAVLGFIGFYRKLIERFGTTAVTLHSFLNKSRTFFLNEACKTTLKELIEKLQQELILGYPNDEDIYTLPTQKHQKVD